MGTGEVTMISKDRDRLALYLPSDTRLTNSAPRSLTSMWVITTDSVRDAHHLARRLNRNYYHDSVHGNRFPMRASVIW